MKENIGAAQRLIRVVLGIILVIFAFKHLSLDVITKTTLLIVGVFAITTGITGICPIAGLFKKKRQEKKEHKKEKKEHKKEKKTKTKKKKGKKKRKKRKKKR